MAVNAAGGHGLPTGSMFSLGWLLAQLYGPLLARPASGPTSHLPTVAELGEADQVGVALAELKHLVGLLPGVPSGPVEAAWESEGHEGFNIALAELNRDILKALVNDPQQLNAYQLGRALSDTCWLPSNEKKPADFFLGQFQRHRLAALQTWLAQAGDALSAQSAAAVSRSLQNWQDWADINASEVRSKWAKARDPVVAALGTQAHAWHALLAGEAEMASPISLDAWVHAGQSMLRTTRMLMSTAVRRFWPLVVILAAATGGLLYLALAAKSSGMAKVWTSLVTVAASLGVTGGSLRAAAKRAARGLEKDLWQTANLDARAWSVTWLPTLPQSRLQRHHLASRGVAAPQSRDGLEPRPAEDDQ